VPEPVPYRREESVAGSGAAEGVPEGGVSAVPDHHDGDGAMSTAMAISGSTAATFLTHFFGRGLADERYVVERFRAYVAQPIMLRRRRIPFSGGPSVRLKST